MPLQIVDADAMTQGRRIVDTTHAVEFPDKKVAFSIETNAVRAMDVVPHGNELAVRVKHLDTMALPIRYVDIVILVDDHVVRPDELARIDARRAPGEQVLPFGGEFVDRVYAIIHAVHHIVRTNMDAMRPGAEHALTPGAQEVAITVKDDHRV